MLKYSQRHAGRGLFRQPPSSAPPQQRIPTTTETPQQQFGTMPTGPQHQNVIPQTIRGPITQTPGPLPAVSVEPAFPRRRPPATIVEQGRAHPAVTVEPAYPRRPPGPPGGGIL
ncbi:hypothetical protein NECAME_14341 [Necator americanus]|uniref:Uncharacterized protein n=1 Tax=Necator americanus TaxID=51031 RepID=W2SQE5_NECAM|nr:hypothetical protein NECAME_14341 [Necator americanus]ETN71101.1 hypothetical protein NECAME_14341 [Necator americanus]